MHYLINLTAAYVIMLYYDRIDVSEGTGANKSNKSKECKRLRHYWYFWIDAVSMSHMQRLT